MNAVKPIPTFYAGVRFKSRLEARWAVFFDSLDVEWTYEAEGFQLPSRWYVPDFWLPELKVWFEVKPFSMTWDERQKARELCEHSGFAVLVSDGLPRADWQGASFSWQTGCGEPEDEGMCDGETVADHAILVEDAPFMISQYPDFDGRREMWVYLKHWRHNVPLWRRPDGMFAPYPVRKPFCWGRYDEDYTADAIAPQTMLWLMHPHVDAARKAQF